MSEPRIRLITRGDDCGSNVTTSRACLDAFRGGILRNVSVIAPCAAVEFAAELMAGEKGICFGLHITLNGSIIHTWEPQRWGPVLPPEQVPSLVDESGCFPRGPGDFGTREVDADEAFAEIQAQLDRARALGFDIRYVDQHMGIVGRRPGLAERLEGWCEKEGLLNGVHYYHSLPRVEGEGDPVESTIAALRAAAPGQYCIVGHPGYVNEELKRLTYPTAQGYDPEEVARGRDWQRRVFMDPKIVDFCRENGVKPIRYDEAERTR